MQTILRSLYSAIGAAAVLLFLSHLGPRFGKGNFIIELEPPKLFGKELTRRETHLIGVLVHFLLYGLWGILIGFALRERWMPTLGPATVVLIAATLAVLQTLVIMPLEGYGFFGKRHDRWFIFDTFLTQFVWAVMFALLMKLWGSA